MMDSLDLSYLIIFLELNHISYTTTETLFLVTDHLVIWLISFFQYYL
jgi:hypothetical protein